MPSDEQLEAGLYNSGKGHTPVKRKRPYLYAGLLLLALVIIGGAVGLAVARLSSNDDDDAGASEQRGAPGATATGTPERSATTFTPSPALESGAAVPSGEAAAGTDGAPAEVPLPAAPQQQPAPAPPTPVAGATPAPAGAVAAPAPAPLAGAGAGAVEAPAPVAPVPAPAPAPAAMPPPPPALGPSDTWRTLKATPFAVGEVSSGVLTLNGNPYLVTVGEHPDREDDPNHGVTLVYDIRGQQFLTAGKRPEIGNHHASEVYQNRMYLLGGLSAGEAAVQIGELRAGAGGSGVEIVWTQGAALPVPSGSASSALIGGKIWYCGGIADKATIDNCMTYDIAADAWDASSPPPMPAGRNHAATCSDGASMWVFGGRSGENVVGEGFADTQIYSGGAWSRGTPLPFGRGGMGKAVYWQGKCYVFGGEVWSEHTPIPDKANAVDALQTVYSVDIYDVATDSWSRGADLPKGLHGIFPVEYEGGVYVTGGGTEFAFSQSTANAVYIL